MNWKVPLFDVEFGPAEFEAVQAPLRDGWLTMGPKTEELEDRLCELTGARHAVAVNSCTAALHLSLLACGIGPGDEVLCPTLTFVATANAIRYVGATPVFCESVGEGNLNIDPIDVQGKISARTRGIIGVHFAGYPVDLIQLRSIAARHDLVLIEDCAHSLLSRLDGRVCGTWGQCGCFSFFSNKNLTCGEGGAVVTDDEAIAARLKRLRSHGMTTLTLDRHRGRAFSYDVVDLGYNFRLDEIRSSLLLAQFGRLKEFLDARTRHVQTYRALLAGTDIRIPDFEWNVLSHEGDFVGQHIFPIVLPEGAERDLVMTRLKSAGIQSSIHYPPVHLFSSFAGSQPLPRTEAIAARELTLPLFPSMSEAQIEHVCGTLVEVLHAVRESAA